MKACVRRTLADGREEEDVALALMMSLVMIMRYIPCQGVL